VDREVIDENDTFLTEVFEQFLSTPVHVLDHAHTSPYWIL